MAPVWTSEQKKVIELHDRNILVSAAAGSGKTAVLVQRILEMIADEKHPVDIDRLVIVTFTNAAAYEMKQRILAAIENRMEEEPDNLHLRRQQTLINHAQITTIDSFCLNIIRNYFSEIDLDPGFKVADEGELKLLMADTLDEVIEEYYDEGRPEFYEFVECYTPEKTDARLSDYVLNLYRAAQSNPWPKEWLVQCKEQYLFDSEEEFKDSRVMQFITEEMKIRLHSVQEILEELIRTASLPDGPYMYLEALQDDLTFVRRLTRAESFFECAQMISEHTYVRLSAKKDSNVDEEKKSYVKTTRDYVKKALSGMAEEAGSQNQETAFLLAKKCAPFMQVYIDLTMDFMERFDAKKRKKNLINFNDMEHLALQILVQKTEEELRYTKVADELSRKYEEILIDEYQDSNLVQEIILNSISRERFGHPNVFMVGDVKQSIYRFRLARPELFIEKYDSYGEQDGLYQKIELHNNFRSRESVLCSTNEVFEKIMKKEFGRIAYDDNARLYPAAVFPESSQTLGKTEVLILEHEDESDMTDTEAEAMLCAAWIQKIVQKEEYGCFDKERGEYRKLQYRDVVVLMRNARQNADVFVDTLESVGIPAVSESKSGYFDSHEVSILLSLLNIIDNPRQDIPFVAVLKSYFGGFTSNELAQIKASCRDKNFYDAFLLEDSDKKKKFLEFLDGLRKESEYLSIHELIWKIVYDTGYYDFVGTMPMGPERQANIDMLMEKAKTYESTSFHGLFNFVRYIERLKTYDVDYGEASLNSENDDVVRIMTIHKSKGLEFPVVFLTGTQRNFNQTDANQKLVIDSDLGIGTDYMDAALRIRHKTIVKKGLARKIRLAALSEEQRILYVAMTRAKEKLYVTGCVKNLEKAQERWMMEAHRKNLTYLEVTGHKSYLDMVMPAALAENSSFHVLMVKKDAFTSLCEKLEGAVFPSDVQDGRMDDEKEHFHYPYKIIDMPMKMTVSELKYLGQQEMEENSKPLIEQEITPSVPAFISGKEEMKGSERGSAYHKVMEILDFERCTDEDSLKEFLAECEKNGRISKEWVQAVRIQDILKMMHSELGILMKEAFLSGRLFREQQFVMGVEADRIHPDYEEDNMMLVQGVVDVYADMEEGLVLADYKTDRVPKGEEGRKILKERYQTQLDYYELALSRLTGKAVVRKSIYSFCLQEEILLSRENNAL